VEWNQIVTVKPLLWAKFVPTKYPDGDTSKKAMSNVYCELTNKEKLLEVVTKNLASYNKRYPAKKMDIVLFE
jgi:dynein heavy chain